MTEATAAYLWTFIMPFHGFVTGTPMRLWGAKYRALARLTDEERIFVEAFQTELAWKWHIAKGDPVYRDQAEAR